MDLETIEVKHYQNIIKDLDNEINNIKDTLLLLSRQVEVLLSRKDQMHKLFQSYMKERTKRISLEKQIETDKTVKKLNNDSFNLGIKLRNNIPQDEYHSVRYEDEISTAIEKPLKGERK